MIYLLTVILLILCLVLGYLLRRAVILIREYENFFNQGAEDMSMVVEGINAILLRKPLMSEDEDVRTLIRGIKIGAEILNAYAKEKDAIRTNTTRTNN